jgi:hypothetical protein
MVRPVSAPPAPTVVEPRRSAFVEKRLVAVKAVDDA